MWPLALASLLIPRSSCVPREPPCPALPPRRDAPRDVRDLRPDDVGLVLALGDSITAGFGLKGGFEEYRGESFSVGGDPGAWTLPNLLRVYGGNEKATGSSIGVRRGIHTSDRGCEGGDVALCNLNAGVDGANMRRLLPQVEYLSRLLGSGGERDAPFRNHTGDWKVVTIFAGIADAVFSAAPEGRGPTPTPDFRASFERVLWAIKARLGGRVYVNVLALPRRLSHVESTIRDNVGCKLFYALSHLPGGPVRWTDPASWDRAIDEYNEVMQLVVRKHAGLDPSFVVVFQPFLRDLLLESQMLEHMDCLHPNRLLAGNMSVALWNSMIGAKAVEAIDFLAEPLCPSEATRLRWTEGQEAGLLEQREA